MTTIPNKTTPPAPGLKKQVGLFSLNNLLVILLDITIFSLFGAHPIHIIGGILLLVGCGIHLVLHRRWIKAVILETPKNVTPALRQQQRLFWGLFLSGSICGLSGLISLPFILMPHAFFALHCLGTPIHILSGLSFLGFGLYHLILHRNWFRKNLAIFSSTSR